MNDDLISRDALKRHITEIFEIEKEFDKKWAMGLKYSLKLIDNAPTVEITDYDTGYQDGLEDGLNDIRLEGKWIEGYHNYFETLDCSLCGYVRDNRYSKFNFCPNCGADMRYKEAENEIDN